MLVRNLLKVESFGGCPRSSILNKLLIVNSLWKCLVSLSLTDLKNHAGSLALMWPCWLTGRKTRVSYLLTTMVLAVAYILQSAFFKSRNTGRFIHFVCIWRPAVPATSRWRVGTWKGRSTVQFHQKQIKEDPFTFLPGIWSCSSDDAVQWEMTEEWIKSLQAFAVKPVVHWVWLRDLEVEGFWLVVVLG